MQEPSIQAWLFSQLLHGTLKPCLPLHSSSLFHHLLMESLNKQRPPRVQAWTYRPVHFGFLPRMVQRLSAAPWPMADSWWDRLYPPHPAIPNRSSATLPRHFYSSGPLSAMDGYRCPAADAPRQPTQRNATHTHLDRPARSRSGRGAKRGAGQTNSAKSNTSSFSRIDSFRHSLTTAFVHC